LTAQPTTTGAGGDRQIVLGTKLTPPPARPEHIARERLLDQLDEATTRPLTVISAPTGFGKSTLLGAWARRGTHRTAWLTLTDGDADTVRLMAGILAALRRAGASIDGDVDRDLVGRGADPANRLLPRVLASLDDSAPTVLILDDYHQLTGAPAHGLIAEFVAGMPDCLRVVIGTRADPALPLGRLRAVGSMQEIRSDVLRFDTEETERFLNESLGLDLDPTSVATLEERTEGWPAGLYLAALGMRRRTDRAEFVADFAGSSRHVVDYLSAEVLRGLQPEDRTFLLHTSILRRLCGPLCDMVTGMTGSSIRLRELERANLFIVPLDERGTWFRFHRLFAELLRSELADESPDLVVDLHRRASAWHAQHGPVEAAVEHAIAAGDRTMAATLLARSWRDFARTGELQTLERLIASLGEDRGAVAGPVAVVEAMVAGLLGREPAIVRHLIATAEASGWDGPTPDGRSIKGLADVVTVAFLADDLAGQKEAAQRLIKKDDEDPEYVAMGRAGLSMVMTLEGDATAALAVLEGLALPTDYPNVTIYAEAARSLATTGSGDPIHAERLARDTLARADAWGLASSTTAGSLWLALGSAVNRQGRPREAIPQLERALAQWGVPGTFHRAQVLTDLATAYLAVGEPVKARAAVQEAREIVDGIAHAGALPACVHAVEKQLRIGAAQRLPDSDVPSEAEIRVLRLLATPLSAREIGDQLYISMNTVKTHTKSLYQKLGTSSREETVRRARRLGLL
jgi:LuxR family transcriptional regulator, maltose regulon positive regulatory protein